MKAISQPSVAARELRVTQAPLSTDLVNLVQHVAVSVSSIRRVVVGCAMPIMMPILSLARVSLELARVSGREGPLNVNVNV
jgi:hypothetical protein